MINKYDAIQILSVMSIFFVIGLNGISIFSISWLVILSFVIVSQIANRLNGYNDSQVSQKEKEDE